MNKLSVLIKEPGRAPRHVNISDSFQNLQKTVDGYIESIELYSDVVILCDEEARIKQKPYCCTCDPIKTDLYGTIVLIGTDGNGLCDLPGTFTEWKNVFSWLWR